MSDEMNEQIVDAIRDMTEELGTSLVRIDCSLRDDDEKSVFRDKDGFSLLASLPAISSGLHAVANAITPVDATPGRGAVGGYVASLTESVMGVTRGLLAIANSIEMLANAVEAISDNQPPHQKQESP